MVSVGGEEPEVLVNVLVSTLILPDVDKLVLITDKHAEVTQAAPVKNIFVSIYKTCEDKFLSKVDILCLGQRVYLDTPPDSSNTYRQRLV